MSQSKRKPGLTSESAHVVNQGVSQLRDPLVKTSEKVLIVIGIVYALSPIDFLPDVLPPFTYADDVVITGGAVTLVLLRVITRSIAQKIQRTVQNRHPYRPLR